MHPAPTALAPPGDHPGEVNVWTRKNGNFTLVLQAGVSEDPKTSLGLPYGPLPRLLLLWLVTEAIRTKSRTIKLSGSLSEFLREIGLDPQTGRGPRGDATRLKEQMMRLFNCRISFRYSQGNAQKGHNAFLSMEVAREGRFWWDNKTLGQEEIFESEIVLGEVFYKAITAAPVPVDMRALLAVKKSPLAIDLYTWTTYRLFTMRQAGDKQIRIPLSELKEQFGSEYNRLRNFKAALSEALDKVQKVFPAFDYHFEENNFILRDNGTRPAITPIDKTAAQRRLAELTNLDQVSEKTRAWFQREFPVWDVDVMINDFYFWREKNGGVSRDTDSHFKAFARTWIEHNR